MSLRTFGGRTHGSRTSVCNSSSVNRLVFSQQLLTTLNHCYNVITIFIYLHIVIPIWKEPLPGWTDNINGPTGLLIGAGKGVIRTMYCDNKGYADYLPVDITVNGIILVTWNYIGNK